MACVVVRAWAIVAAAGVLSPLAFAFVAPASSTTTATHPTPTSARRGGRRVPNRRRVAPRCSQAAPIAPAATADDGGLHGSAFCFLPLDQLDSENAWPRLLRVAGAYPGLTAAELAAAPESGEPATKGSWSYEFPDAHGAEFGLVAVPGNDLLHFADDPVAIVASSEALGVPLREDTELLLVVDRAARALDPRAFFAFAEPSGNIVVRRFDADPPPGWTVAGRVVFVNLPYDPTTQAASGTWLEEGDVSM